MPSLAEYQKKLNLLRQLEEEVKDIEEDPSFASQIEFVRELDELLEKHGKSRSDLAALLPSKEKLSSVQVVPRQGESEESRPRKPTPIKIFLNPHTNERVEARNTNNYTLRNWIVEYGREAVMGWVVDEYEPEDAEAAQ